MMKLVDSLALVPALRLVEPWEPARLQLKPTLGLLGP